MSTNVSNVTTFQLFDGSTPSVKAVLHEAPSDLARVEVGFPLGMWASQVVLVAERSQLLALLNEMAARLRQAMAEVEGLAACDLCGMADDHSHDDDEYGFPPSEDEPLTAFLGMVVSDCANGGSGEPMLAGCPAGGPHVFRVSDESPTGPRRVPRCDECGALPPAADEDDWSPIEDYDRQRDDELADRVAEQESMDERFNDEGCTPGGWAKSPT